jgi:uncharacterized protein (DUF1330 family)
MAKGYLVAHVDIHNDAPYQEYAALARVAQEKYGAKVLARGGRSEALEGKHRKRNVVIEFESYEAALNYYNSPEYQAARLHRVGNAEADFIVVEGV